MNIATCSKIQSYSMNKFRFLGGSNKGYHTVQSIYIFDHQMVVYPSAINSIIIITCMQVISPKATAQHVAIVA